MKKIKLLFISCAMALALTGCSKAGQLPPGGKKVDLSTEAGQALLKEKVQKTADAYKETPDAVAIKASVQSLGLGLTGSTKNEFGAVSLDASASIDGKVEANFRNSKEKLVANTVISGLGADVKLKGSIPVAADKKQEFDTACKFSGVSGKAFYQAENLYVDYSSESVRKALNKVSDLANDMAKAVSGEEKPEELDLNKMIDDATGTSRRKIIIPTSIQPEEIFDKFKFEYSDEGFEEAMKVFNEVSFMTFKTYTDGRYGLEVNINKDILVKLIRATSDAEDVEKDVKDAEETVKSFDLKAALLFEKSGFLSELSFDINADLNLASLVNGLLRVEGSEFDLTVKGKAIIDLKYNNDVTVKTLTDAQKAEYRELPKEEKTEPEVQP